MKSDHADLVELLPKVLKDFVRLIGFDATMEIVKRRGGVRLYIPKNPHIEHDLAKLIGLENLIKLSRVYGLEDHFDIPKAHRLMLQVRNDKIRAEYGPKSAAQLAREHQLCERQIWSIVGPQSGHNSGQKSLGF